MAFNGQAVLLTPVKGRSEVKPTVQSGTMPRPPLSTPAKPASHEEDPWTVTDPWKQYRKSTVSAPATTHPVPPPSSAAQPARTVGGPTEARFQEQDARLTLIETGLQELRHQADERHKQAQADRQADTARHQADVTELRGQLGSMSTEFAKQLQQSVESLQGSQAQQMQQVMSNFDDLKHMLSCQERDPSKKPRTSSTE